MARQLRVSAAPGSVITSPASEMLTLKHNASAYGELRMAALEMAPIASDDIS